MSVHEIMERSGHQSVGGVRSYERTTDAQRKEVSDVLSDTAIGGECRVALQVINQASHSSTSSCVSSKEVVTNDKENKVVLENFHNCTINFNFN